MILGNILTKGFAFMQAQVFLERIRSYLGISSMVKEYGYQDILEQAASRQSWIISPEMPGKLIA